MISTKARYGNRLADKTSHLMRVLTRFMAAATDAGRFPPPALPEIAFLGRSNVGKSSVINSLVGTKLARTSSTPGRTRSVNFYEVRWPGKPKADLIFADLPGYGYARLAREVVQQWPSFIEPYLKDRPCLTLCVVLIDANIPPQPSDRQLLEFLAAAGRIFVIIATKSDRLSGNQLQKSMQDLANQCQGTRILAYSAKTGTGREELWQEIRLAADRVPQSQS